MTELPLQWIQGIKLLVILVCAMLYGFGGMSGKWKRRYVAPGVYVAAMAGIALWCGTFHWAILTLYLGYCLPIGYSARDGKVIQILRRMLAGATRGIAPVLFVYFTGQWSLLIYHFILCVSVSVFLGVLNPTKSARAEETTIAAAYYLIPIMTMI